MARSFPLFTILLFAVTYTAVLANDSDGVFVEEKEDDGAGEEAISHYMLSSRGRAREVDDTPQHTSQEDSDEQESSSSAEENQKYHRSDEYSY